MQFVYKNEIYHVEVTGGASDDVHYEVEKENGEPADPEVFDYVYKKYSDFLYGEWFDLLVSRSEDFIDSIKDDSYK